MKNLRIVADNLAEWTSTPGEDYGDVAELYGELLGVWSRYAAHVTQNIGGVYELRRTTDDAGQSYRALDAGEQRKALDFLLEEVFTTPEWLMPEDVIRNISASGTVERIGQLQSRQLDYLLSADRLERMAENEALNDGDAYPADAMLADLREGLWSEVSRRRPVSVFRRNLQRAHVNRLMELMEENADTPSDVRALARAELKAIERLAGRGASRYSGTVRYHLEDIAASIAELWS
jgi:hypothetical protein